MDSGGDVAVSEGTDVSMIARVGAVALTSGDDGAVPVGVCRGPAVPARVGVGVAARLAAVLREVAVAPVAVLPLAVVP